MQGIAPLLFKYLSNRSKAVFSSVHHTAKSLQSSQSRKALLCACIALLVVATSTARITLADTPLNLLFIGNSFTAGGPISNLVRDLASDAGWATPQVQYVAPGGQSLNFHTTNPDTLSAIDLGAWDYVVLQDLSTGPTDNLGDPALFKASATTLYDRVKTNSPDAQVLLYETWARHPDHSYYPGSFADPAEMQAQLRSHYNDAADNYIPANSTSLIKTDVAVAPVGDAWENYLNSGGTIRLHDVDDYHAGVNGQYLSAAVIYSSIYQRSVEGRTNLAASVSDAMVLQTFADATTGMTTPGGPGAIELLPPGLGASIQIDFGGDNRLTSGNWNNLTSTSTGTTLVNLIDDSGTTTSVDIAVTDGFAGVNSAGSATNSLGYPTTAGSDSFYTGSFGTHEEGLANPAQVRLSGLNTNSVYDLTIFSSRTGDDGGMGRLTRYTVDGQWQDLEASSNTDNEIVFSNLSPALDGTLLLDVAVSPDGLGRFAYLGLLKLTTVAVPEPSSLVLLTGLSFMLLRRRDR